MMQKFLENEYKIVDFEEKADVYVVNTCTVTNMADKKSRQMLRRVKEINPKSILVVTGCYAQMNEKEIKALGDNIICVPLVKKASLLQMAKHIKASLISNMSS